jgi:hypothetical protein
MTTRFQPARVIATLNRHGVEYILIGGLAATLHGSTLRTGDIDICPARSKENLQRLAKALVELQAKIRTESVTGGLAFSCEAEFLAQVSLLNLETSAGDVDVSFGPSGTTGYDDLLATAERFDLDGLQVMVASLSDVIRSKRAADRSKDREALPVLEELARQLAARKKR